MSQLHSYFCLLDELFLVRMFFIPTATYWMGYLSYLGEWPKIRMVAYLMPVILALGLWVFSGTSCCDGCEGAIFKLHTRLGHSPCIYIL